MARTSCKTPIKTYNTDADLFCKMTWVFVIMGNTYDIKRGEWRSDTHSLLSAQELWFAVFMTIL